MVFSLICTMIYTTNILFEDIVLDEQKQITEEQNEIVKEIEKLNTDINNRKISLENCEAHVKVIQSTYQNNITETNSRYGDLEYKQKYIENYVVNEKEALKNAMEAFLLASKEAGEIEFTEDQTHYVNTGIARYEAIKMEYEYAQNMLSEARRSAEVVYNSDWEQIKKQISDDFQEESDLLNMQIDDLKNEINALNSMLDSLKSTLTETNYGVDNEKYSNKYVKALNIFILYWVHIFETSSHYERAYLVIIGMISLLIAGMMEYIIFFINQIIGQPIKILWDLLVPKDNDLTSGYKELLSKCEDFLLIIVKASLCSAIYLFLYVATEVYYNDRTMDWANNVKLLLIMAIVYFIIYCIFNKIVFPKGSKTLKSYEPSDIWPQKIKQILKLVVPASRKWWINLINGLPNFVFSILLFLVLASMSLFLYPETSFASKDEFLWTFVRSVVVGIIGVPLNNISKIDNSKP